MPFATTCTTAQQRPITIGGLTVSGQPATLDGAPTVVVQSGTGTFTQDPATPNVIMLVSGSVPEDVTYLITGDADTGAGVTPVADVVTLTVTGEAAASLGFTAGPAEAKPAAPVVP